MKVREPSVAGMFYPKEPARLLHEINYHYTSAEKYFCEKEIFGMVAPHAGYIYSGTTACFAYKSSEEKKYKTIIVLSPSHYEYFDGITIYNGDKYKTPLGEIEIDSALASKYISSSTNIYKGIEGHRKEHAIEVHLPFLQKVFGDFKLLPVVMGDQNKNNINQLSNAIANNFQDDQLIVASSDLSHFYKSEIADALDERIESRINDFDYEGLLEDLQSEKSFACGGGLIVAMMQSLKSLGLNTSKVLKRTNSGEVSGDYSSVVGYLSSIIF